MAGLTIDDPVTLTQALASVNIIAGDVLLLRAGTYSGNYTVPYSGTAGNYITIKNYPGERAIINGSFRINGDYIRVIGLESRNDTVRNRTAQVGSGGFNCLGNYIDIVNCLVHDHDTGLVTSGSKTGHVYYGNLFYFNGWDSNNGHGMYPQNNDGNIKTIKRNILFDNFAYGIHAWGANGDVSDFVIDGNIVFENGAPRSEYQDQILNGNQSTFTSPRIFNNLTYNIATSAAAGLRVGYGVGHTALDVEVYDNYLANVGRALEFHDETISRFDGNTLIGTLAGADLGSNTQLLSYPVSGSHIVLTNNAYDANRAQLAIYNWSLANTVVVNVSAIYANGTELKVRNVQDYFIDIQTLTVTAGNITINMEAANRTVATPVGWTALAKTFPQFGAFVLEVA